MAKKKPLAKKLVAKKIEAKKSAVKKLLAAPLQQFVILPPRGVNAVIPEQQAFFLALNNMLSIGKSALKSFVGPANIAEIIKAASIPVPKLRVLDEMNHETSAKLVEMSPDDITALRMQNPGARVVPVIYYDTLEVPPEEILKKLQPAGTSVSTNLVLQVVDGATGKGIGGAKVVAFTDFASREGASVTTTKSGKASLPLAGSAVKIERLYIYPKHKYWGLLKKNLKLKSGDKVKLNAITFPTGDLLEKLHGAGQATDGKGVKVAVLDTGCGPHADLSIAGGESTVLGENSAHFHDNGDQHGTHVAGIIAAKGTAPQGRAGLAPGVTLFSYRVFGKGKRATNFAIAKAIDKAAQIGCHLINLSLGGGPPDPVISSAISDARTQGAVVIVAAGNDGRQPVAFPASDPRAIAVSALGRKGTFPADSIDSGNIQGPASTINAQDFIASFSNVGLKIELTGAGVGIVSTVPGGYAVMSGTSMACPAVMGIAARLLAKNPAILNAAADEARSEKIMRLLLAAAKNMGFPSDLQGQGLPQ